MLKRFSVKNFKNFKEKITLDFSSPREYSFNDKLVSNRIIKKMLIYGENNSGKSNLGAAIMDIATHLTDNLTSNILYKHYINGDSIENFVEFHYDFDFNNRNVTYKYKKDKDRKLIDEEIFDNDDLLFRYNYLTNKCENYLPEAINLDLSKRNKDISVLKYIFARVLYSSNTSVLNQLYDFVNNMLWFRCLRENEFIGYMVNGESLDDYIINNKKLEDFSNFLKECGQYYNLCIIDDGVKKVIGVEYMNMKARLNEVASNGTLSLWLFYYWMNRTDKIKFLYLDEFDAFYHFKLATHILNYINSHEEFQSILTSHNTSLAKNNLMRPDCYFILENGVISSFADRTEREIRVGHNLEKLLRSGEFNEK